LRDAAVDAYDGARKRHWQKQDERERAETDKHWQEQQVLHLHHTESYEHHPPLWMSQRIERLRAEEREYTDALQEAGAKQGAVARLYDACEAYVLAAGPSAFAVITLDPKRAKRLDAERDLDVLIDHHRAELAAVPAQRRAIEEAPLTRAEEQAAADRYVD